MNIQAEKLLKVLLEPGETTCFTPNPYGTEIKKAPADGDLFYSINAIKANSSRLDANVTSYRNFLLELDNIPLAQQISLVRDRLPITSIVYSGGKSYHFIISLTEPLPDETAYRRTARGLMEAVPEADRTTKNPSRLSRLPGVLRPDTGNYQELIYLGSRIALAELPEPAPYREPKAEPTNIMFVTQQLLDVLDKGIDNVIAARFGGRNQFFYWLGRRSQELGHTREQKKALVDKFYNKLENKRKFSIAEAYSAARVKI